MTKRPSIDSRDRAEARRDLAAALEQLNLAPDGSQLERLLALAEILQVWGTRINLTGHKTLAAIVRGLVIDCAALACELPEVGTLVDLGSGAGFPGLPIAILRPNCQVTLVEARERRHHFQKAAIRELELENVSPLRGRAESLTPILHAAAIAQAMARPKRALAWMPRWVDDGGWVLIPGSSIPPTISPQPGVIVQAPIHYRVPLSERDRALWIARIASSSPT